VLFAHSGSDKGGEMVPAIVIGRGGSKGFARKNVYELNGSPLMSYPISAARGCKEVDEVFFSTEDGELEYLAEYHGATVINRPSELATDEALAEDVFVHAYKWIKDCIIGGDTGFAVVQPFELVVLMFANAPCITAEMISKMIAIMKEKRSQYSSICTVSRYNMFSPYRARVIITLRRSEGWLLPFCPDIMDGVDCNRDSGDDAWFYDCSCAVVTPECLEFIEGGMLPQRWLGPKILGYKQKDPALDIDYEWQLGQIEWWLRRNLVGYGR